jgi:hypothetical protein
MLLKKTARFPHGLVYAAQRTAAVTRYKACCVESSGSIALMLEHGQPHQRLDTRHVGSGFVVRIFIV